MLDDIRPPEIDSDDASQDPPKTDILRAPKITAELDGDSSADVESSSPEEPSKDVPGKKPRRSLLKWFKSLRKRTRIFMLVTLLLFLLTGSSSAYLLYKSGQVKEQEVPVPVYIKPEPPKPTTEPSKLTGLQVAPEVNAQAVLAVMIENSPDARPQSGLKDAGIVFEAIAEGGITRFLTLWQDTSTERLGPIRSLRPYYIDWFVPYQAAIAHAGGSGEALTQVRNEGLRDIDHGANGGAFSRVRERYAPHNLYSSVPRLREAMTSRGYTTSEFTGLARKEKEEPLATPTARTIDINISGPLYAVHYDYDAASNSYLRSVGGAPHRDETGGLQLSPKVVVTLAIPWSQTGIYSVYQVNGTGTAYVFQDGNVTQVTWEKPSRSAQYTFKNADGTPYLLNPGQTWFTAVADAGRVVSAP